MPRGRPPNFQEEVDQLPLALVKTLPDIGTSTSSVLAAELRKLEVERGEVPSVFGARGSSGPRIQLRVLPRSNPRPEMLEPDNEVEPIDLG